jgi:hypothetical protein
VYSWEQMLKRADSDAEENYKNFGFAKEMQKAGWLDCYCFISVYHYAFHKQYEDFASKNAERIREYISTQLMK